MSNRTKNILFYGIVALLIAISVYGLYERVFIKHNYTTFESEEATGSDTEGGEEQQ